MKARMLFVALCIAGRVAAQDCDAILEHGIYDVYQVSDRSHFEEILHHAASMSYEQWKATQQSDNFNFGVVYKVINSLSVGTESEKQSFERFKAAYATQTDHFVTSDQGADLLFKKVNESIVAAWRDCKLQHSELLVYYTGDPRDRFTVTLVYHPKNKINQSLNITRLSGEYSPPVPPPGSAELTIPSKKSPIVITPNSSFSQTFQRFNPSHPESILINFGDRGEAIALRIPSGPDPVVVDLQQQIRQLQQTVDSLHAQVDTLRTITGQAYSANGHMASAIEAVYNFTKGEIKDAGRANDATNHYTADAKPAFDFYNSHPWPASLNGGSGTN